MKYITTSCKNCGYRTRNYESGVPSVQLDMPIFKCPKCGHLILDPIQTEYEFMTATEKANFSTQSALPKSYLGNILFIIVGVVLLIGGISLGDIYVWAGLIFGGGCLALGIFQIIRNQKIANDQTIEQAVYESLQRTSNPKYVEFIIHNYELNGINRNYSPLSNRTAYIEKYNEFELRETYKQRMNTFNQFMELINTADVPEQSNVSTFYNH